MGQLQYIYNTETNARFYDNFNITASNNMEVEMQFRVLNSDEWLDRRLFLIGSAYHDCYAQFQQYNVIRCGFQSFAEKTTTVQDPTAIHTVSVSKDAWLVDGVSLGTLSGTPSVSGNGFSINTNSNMLLEIYYITVKDSGVLTHNYLPWDNNGVVGLMDVIEDTFYAPTTGTFIGVPLPTPTSDSKIYLGSTNLGTGKIRLGGADVSAIYLGTSLLYPPSGPTPPTPTPTLVDYVHTSTASLTANYINTGIYPTTDTVFRIVFKPNQKMGNCIVGYDFTGAPDSQKSTPTGASSDNTDYRLINYSTNNKMHLDFNNSRIEKTMSTDSDGYIDITCGNNYITDDISQSTQTGTTQSSMATNNVPIYLNVSSDLDFSSLEIWQNNVKVYDGHAAVNNGTYGVYDSVGGTFTTQTYGGNSMNGGNIAPDINDALCFTAEQANSSVYLTNYGNYEPVIYYSTDNGSNWTQYDYFWRQITLSNVGDKVYFYGNNPNGFSVDSSNYTKFSVPNGSFSISGNIMSLIHYNCPDTIPNTYCFYALFSAASITSARYLELPATTLTESCYAQMFHNSNLTVPPQLPATTLANSCYAGMFEGTNITTSPRLGVTTLVQSCYFEMFKNCSNLNSVTCLATSISALNCTYEWLSGVAQTGTFYKSTVPNWSTGASGIPTGWTTQDVYTCADDYVIMGYGSEGQCACTEDGNNMGHASLGDCMCNEFNECIDCSTDWETLGYESQEDCNCQMYDTDCPVDCSDCNNYAECEYESYEDCNCQQYGEDCPPDPCQECIDACEGDSECEGACYKCDEPCGTPCEEPEDPCEGVDCSDCSNWDNECCGYESYEDCDCQVNGNCGEEEPSEEEPEE